MTEEDEKKGRLTYDNSVAGCGKRELSPSTGEP
jgi:hypothetical protein